jgi:hypothetical protein
MNEVPNGLPPFEFQPEYIKARFLDHWILAEQFCPPFAGSFGLSDDCFMISTRKLKLVIESAYQDIARYKQYHQDDPYNERLDCTKRCAFLLKWLVRFKPIQLADSDIETEQLDYAELINEAFALYLFDIHLSDELGMDVCLSEQKTQQFAYDLLYRQISVDGWIAIFQLIKEACTPENLASSAPFIENLPTS